MRTQHKQQIIGLDVIRAAAAVMVMLFHLGYWHWTRASDPNLEMPSAYIPLIPALSAGWVGVEIFFVLSGFVIAYSAEGTAPARFVRHRLDRLVPTAVLCATITATVLLLAYPLRLVSELWLKSVIFFPVGPWVDGSYWTLPIEVAFYAVVFVTLLIESGRYRSVTLAVVGVVSTAVCLLRAFPVLLPVRWDFLLAGSLGFPPLACLLLVHGCFFAFGVFLYLSLLQEWTKGRACLLLVLGTGCVAELISHEIAFSSVVQGKGTSWLGVSLWLSAVGGLVLSVKGNAWIQERVRPRGVRVARQIGIATYPLYLLHDKVGQVLIGGLHHRLGYGFALLLASVLLMASAVFVSQVLEPPTRNVLRKLWQTPATEPRKAAQIF